MNRIANCARLGSLDLMELNPARDMRSRTAKAVVVLMRELFAQSPRH
jgi:arginase